MSRTFEIKPATRQRVPLLVGLTGPSGGGKTFSALRLATGMQRVTGGRVVLIDTESRRALHYASAFDFDHMEFGAPFHPSDYLAAIQAAVNAGASVVIVDSTSHEWEGPGGVLESHDEEAKSLAKRWNTSLDKVKLTAWAKPKADHRRLVNTMLQMPIHLILAFRAKEKLKIQKGKDPEPLGFQPIAADDLIYELTVNCLLPPGAGGVPSWNPPHAGERQMVKLPGWAEPLFPQGRALDEETGESLARWAEGDVGQPSAAGLLTAYAECADPDTLAVLEQERRQLWRTASADEKQSLKAAAAEAKARVSGEAA